MVDVYEHGKILTGAIKNGIGSESLLIAGFLYVLCLACVGVLIELVREQYGRKK